MSPDISPVPPEAEVIRLAREAMDMTAQSAAEASRAHDGKGVSAAYWRDVERGYGGRRGKRVRTRASDRALAAMARVVGVMPPQLAGAGREDAARVLEEILRREHDPAPVTSTGSITIQPLAAAASESDLLPTTEAMELAIRAHTEEVQMRVEFARRRNPGQSLTGSMVFPASPRDARNWDSLIRDGEPEEAVIQGIAALAAWRAEKARATENGTVTEINRRARS